MSEYTVSVSIGSRYCESKLSQASAPLHQYTMFAYQFGSPYGTSSPKREEDDEEELVDCLDDADRAEEEVDWSWVGVEDLCESALNEAELGWDGWLRCIFSFSAVLGALPCRSVSRNELRLSDEPALLASFTLALSFALS